MRTIFSMCCLGILDAITMITTATPTATTTKERERVWGVASCGGRQQTFSLVRLKEEFGGKLIVVESDMR